MGFNSGFKGLKVKQLNYFFIKVTQLLVLPHLHRPRTQLLSHLTASVCCLLLMFPHLNLSPYNPFYLSPPLPERTLTDWPFKCWIKSHLPFAGIIRSSPFSPR